MSRFAATYPDILLPPPVLVHAPAADPVSLTEVKAHLRIDHTDDDTMLGLLIKASVGYVDGWSGILGRALVTQTWRQDFERFEGRMRLPLAPVASIASIAYFDGDNEQQTLSDAVYDLFADALGPYAGLKPDQRWPSPYARPDAISVTHVAGYGDASAVPQAIKVAIMMIVAQFYRSREAVSDVSFAELPFGAMALLAPYRRIGV